MKTRGGKPWFERSGGFGSGIGGIRVSKTTSAVSLTTLGHIVAFEMADGKAFSKPERMTAAMAARVIMTAAGILFRCLGSSGVIVFCCLFVWRHLAVCCPTACQPATVTIRFPACPAGLSRFNPHLLRGAGGATCGSRSRYVFRSGWFYPASCRFVPWPPTFFRSIHQFAPVGAMKAMKPETSGP